MSREHDDLDRWTALVAAEARGERLDDEAQAFRERLEQGDPALAAEAPLWQAIGRRGLVGESAVSDAELAAAVLTRARAEPAPLLRLPRRSVAVALLLAAAVMLSFAAHHLFTARALAPDDHASAAPMSSPPPVVEAVLWLAPGSRTALPAGRCAAVTDDLDVCASRDAVIEVLTIHDAIDLNLLEGTVEIFAADEPLPLRVTTALGDITASRAVFAIGRDDAGLRLDRRAGEAELHTLIKQPADVAAGLAPPAAPREAIASPEELLREAQARLGDGDAARAIAAYETLLRHHPRSVEAQAARISLGNLLLVRNQPARALRAFDRYLDVGGDLAEEALYGKIGALRRLGRAREVEAASEEFLNRYPDSLYAPKVRAQQGSPAPARKFDPLPGPADTRAP